MTRCAALLGANVSPAAASPSRPRSRSVRTFARACGGLRRATAQRKGRRLTVELEVADQVEGV